MGWYLKGDPYYTTEEDNEFLGHTIAAAHDRLIEMGLSPYEMDELQNDGRIYEGPLRWSHEEMDQAVTCHLCPEVSNWRQWTKLPSEWLAFFKQCEWEDAQ